MLNFARILGPALSLLALAGCAAQGQLTGVATGIESAQGQIGQLKNSLVMGEIGSCSALLLGVNGQLSALKAGNPPVLPPGS